MSGKRFNPMDDPPTASSSDDDEVETSIGDGEEIDGSSSSEEEDNVSSRKQSANKPQTALAATEKDHVSDSESGSDSETDSDGETERKDPVKNQVSASVKSSAVTKDSAVVKKHDSKKFETLSKPASKKRSIEADGAAASTDAKRVKRVSGEEEKKSGGGGGEETKKTHSQRLWSEEDEIALLQGIIDYKTDTGVSPYEDTNGFYQLVKKSISFDVTKVQFMEKLRSMKKKFENNVGKGKNGEKPTFSKHHDLKTFDLSQIIWGANGILSESAVKSNGKLNNKSRKSKKVESVEPKVVSSLQNGKSCKDEVTTKGGEVELDSSVLVKSLGRFGVDDLAAQQGWTRLAAEDKKRFEEQWNSLQAREFEFYSQRSGFIHEVVTKMAEAFRSNP